MKCLEKYIKAYIFFFIIQWIEFKFENVKYISIYLTNFKKNIFRWKWFDLKIVMIFSGQIIST